MKRAEDMAKVAECLSRKRKCKQDPEFKPQKRGEKHHQ
jgi:hypothetical protein